MTTGAEAATGRLVRRIAHGYGNRRGRIATAIDADIDLIEADVRWNGREAWVRHEHRLGPFPLLFNQRLSAIHREGPFGLRVGRFWFRADVRPISLRELLVQTKGHVGLMLDLKAGRYSARERYRFIRHLFGLIDQTGFTDPLGVCGEWSLLDTVRDFRPTQPVHYSVDDPDHWKRMEERLRSDADIEGITLRRDLITIDRASFLQEHGIDVIAWDIDTREQAEAVLALGVGGIIADDLSMLAELGGRPVQGGALA